MSLSLTSLQEDIEQTRNETSNMLTLRNWSMLPTISTGTQRQESHTATAGKHICITINCQMKISSTASSILTTTWPSTLDFWLDYGRRWHHSAPWPCFVVVASSVWKEFWGFAGPTWRAQIEYSYQTSSNNHLLCAQNQGAQEYTDKFNAKHPGEVLKLFRYTQRTIGNQASYADLAHCVNNAGVDWINLNRNKSKFNSTNV